MTPQTDPKLWWEYVASCKMADARKVVKQWNWNYIKERWKNRDIYVKLFRKKLEIGLDKVESYN
jgi:hypothetical protein